MTKPQVFNTWTREETDAFLSRHDIGRMGTIDENGFPHVMPMWYTLFEGFVYITFSVPKKKHANLKRNRKMSLTVDAGDGFDSYHGVMIQGWAEYVEDLALLERFYIAWTYRHFGSDADPYRRMLAERPGRVIKLVPEKTVTWDHRRLVR